MVARPFAMAVRVSTEIRVFTIPDFVVALAGGGPLGHPKIFINLVCFTIASLVLGTE